MSMTPRHRVLRALRGGVADRVPFTMYDPMCPQCTGERELRNRGLCLLIRQPVYRIHRPNVRTHSREVLRDGQRLTEIVHETPHGTLTMLTRPAGITTWCVEHLFKSPEDYKALAFYLGDEQVEPTYGPFLLAESAVGGDGLLRAQIGLEPLQELISGEPMGTETFCIEWMERQDEVLALKEILAGKHRRRIQIVAESPATHANYGGNVTPQIIGPAVYEEHYLPYYAAAADVLEPEDVLLGSHYDADCKPIAGAIARSKLDYIEAFTPAPDTDMALAEARAAWPGKVLWLNFPSSVHLQPPAAVREKTVALLDELDDLAGVIMGITENIPADRWQASCLAIQAGLEDHARANPERYEQS